MRPDIVTTINEQRTAKRSSVNWPVSVWHAKAAQFFNGRSVDVSRAGVLITIPMKVPIHEGQNLEINFPRTEQLARQKGRFARVKNARVVRIDRSDALRSANVKVGLSFRPDHNTTTK